MKNLGSLSGFGYDPQTGATTAPHQDHVVDMMTIDNLPNEMPRDASTAFGEMFIKHVLPELQKEKNLMLEKATIAQDGILGSYFTYLKDYFEGDA